MKDPLRSKSNLSLLALCFSTLFIATSSILAGTSQTVFRNLPVVKTDLSTVPWVENLENEETLSQWIILDANDDGSTWVYNQSPFPSHPEGIGTGLVSYRFNNTNDADDWFFSPLTNYQAGKTYRLRWWEYGGSSYGGEQYEVTIGPNNSPAFHTKKLHEQPTTYSRFVEHDITFQVDATGDYRLGFHVITPKNRTTLYLDGIQVDEVNPVDMRVFEVSGTAATSVGTETTHSVKVQNNGTEDIANFRVSLIDKDDNELGFADYEGEALAKDATADVLVTWTPSPYALGDDFQIRGKVTAENDVIAKNDAGETFMIDIHPYATYNIDFGDFASTMNMQAAPFDFRGRHSGTQSIYFEKDVNKFGYINSITYYTNFYSGAEFLNERVQMYMSTVDTEVTKVPVGWLKDNLTLVFDGTVNFPTGRNAVSIKLDNPFLYTEGNLVITTIRSNPDVGTSFSAQFVYTLANNSVQRTRSWYGSAPFDYSQTGTTPSAIPNASFIINSYGGVLTGVVKDNGSNPVEGATVYVDGTQWKTVTDAEGIYKFPFLPVNSYEVTVVKEGYISKSTSVDIAYGETTTTDFSLEATTNTTVNGKIVDIENAIVVLSGETTYQTQTDGAGGFQFDNVYGPKAYKLRVFKGNYKYYEADVNIPEISSYTIDDIVMESCEGVEITKFVCDRNTPEWYSVTLTWEAPAVGVKGYNIYRNGELLNAGSFINELTYIDHVTELGDHTYSVTVISSEGCESEFVSEQVTIEPYPCEIAVTDFPFYEDFEANQFSSCWTQEYTDLRTPWEVVYQNEDDVPAPYKGKFNAKFRTVNRGTVTKLVSPKLDITGLSKPVLTFVHLHPVWGASGAVDALRIYYKSSKNAPWLLLKEFTESRINWKEETIILPEPTNDYWIAFEGTSDYGKGLYLDEIKVLDDICAPVTNVSVLQQTETTVELKWDAPMATGLNGYKITRDGVQIASGLKYPVYTDTNVTLGEHVYNIIATYQGREECTESSAAIAEITVVEKCDPVTKLTSRIVNEKVKLTWEMPTAKNIASYTIKRGEETIASNITVTGYEDSEPANGYNTYSVIVNYGSGKECTESEPTYTDILVKCDGVNDLSYEMAETNRSLTLTWKVDIEGGVKNPLDQDKARIVLKSLNIWEDNSGYQMLLDADANTFGSVIPSTLTFYFANEGNISQHIYDMFEYKIPANADGALNTRNIIYDGSAYVDVPAGTYDYIIMRPMPEDNRMCIADGIYGRGAAIKFEAGKVYTFEVERQGAASVTNVRQSSEEEIATFEVYHDNKLVSTTRELYYTDSQIVEGGTYNYCVVPKYDSGCIGGDECISIKVDCPTPYDLDVVLTEGDEFCTAVLNWKFEEFPKRADQRNEEVIYSSGPYVTHKGIGYNGADISAVSDGKGTIAATAQALSGNFIMDDFELTEKTYISEMEFFLAFDLSDPNIHPNDLRIIIIKGDPSDPNAPVVWGNWTDNRFTSSKFTGIYRTDDGSNDPSQYLSNMYPIISVKGAVETTLAPGTYWVGIGAANKDVSVTNGPYAIPVSILGTADTGNAVRVRSTGITPFVDNTTGDKLGLAFNVYGAPVIPLFNVYRDSQLIAENVEGNTYTDSQVTAGEHTWEVVFQCEGGESLPAVSAAFTCEGGSSVGEDILSDISLFPNPAKDHIIIKGEDLERIEIFNATGQLSEIVILRDQSENTVNLASYAPGLYLFKIYGKDGKAVIRNVMVK